MDHLPEHRSLLRRAFARFRDDDRVPGLVLGGSLARGDADLYSDVDLYVVSRDEAFDAVFAERDAAAEAIGDPLLRFAVDPVPGGSTDFIVTYPGPVKLDLMYHRESEVEPGPKWKDKKVLKDDSGTLVAVVSRSEGPGKGLPAPEPLAELEQRFWTLCWYVFGKISRGELWEALDGVHAIRGEILLPLIDRTAGRPHEGYRRLERKLDPETLASLAATVAPVRPEALYAALRAEMSLFRDLRADLSARHGPSSRSRSTEIIEAEITRRWARESTRGSAPGD